MDEKLLNDSASQSCEATTHRTRRSSRPGWAIVAVFLLLAVWSLRPDEGTWFPLQTTSPSEQTKAFSWDALKPTPHLEYQDCYERFKCARLELPMDYWNGTTNATVSIAIIKLPAAVPVTHPQYGGPILFNPGGPGGSGVYLVQAAADGFRQVIDSKGGKYYDYVGFDPRGVGQSRPVISCLDDPLLEQSWGLRLEEEGLIGASDAAFGRLWSMMKALSGSCALPRTDGEPSIKNYASTASVATDMLEFVERHGEWREKEAHRLLNEGTTCRSAMMAVEVPDTLKHKSGREKINYWGFSYGSLLGNTFAAMYPDRVHRLIVDGVVDADDYKKSLWMDNLVDTEKDMDLFYFHCARVGFPICPLANTTGTTTAEGVKNRTLAILQSLYHNPLPVLHATSPEVITYSDVKNLIFGVLYGPIYGFPFLAEKLAEVERGDGQRLAEILRAAHSISCPSQEEMGPSEGEFGQRSAGLARPMLGEGDATIGIACTDGDEQSWVTRDIFREHVKNLTTLSPTIGDAWAILRLSCIHYSGVRPNHRFEGPWVGNTSHPLLEIGNTADPVTPGRYAKKMAKGFTGAVALIQDSGGHCSLSARSWCVWNYVQNYFQTGALPPKDTICKVDEEPFGPAPGDATIFDDETRQRMEIQATLSKALLASSGGFFGSGSARSRAFLRMLG